MNQLIPLPPGLTFGLYMVLVVGYLIGCSFNLMIRAGFAYRSMVNCYPTRTSFFVKNWDTILIRVFCYGLGTFYVWTLHPAWATVIAEGLGVPAWLANWLTLPVILATAVLMGTVIDVLLDSVQSVVASKPYLSFLNVLLRGRVPIYDTTVVDPVAVAEKKANQ